MICAGTGQVPICLRQLVGESMQGQCPRCFDLVKQEIRWGGGSGMLSNPESWKCQPHISTLAMSDWIANE